MIAGLSGAGRSHFASNLEDLGWFVIDRLPAEIMRRVSIKLEPRSIRC